ncbi:hypothetical protein HZA55_06555 [Candidatus Poribacteria bacterium]|nr:hypothetical protein [Candidatus Poribacteria bacterium]
MNNVSNILTLRRTFLLFIVIAFIELAGNLVILPFTLLNPKSTLLNELVISNFFSILYFIII